MPTCEVLCGDCLEILPTLSDSSVNLILTDPPYFRVKNLPWDRQWAKPDGYIAWLDQVCEQWHRVLRSNGSLYVFASSKMVARVELALARRFNILNRIVWVKNDGTANRGGFWSRASKKALRSYFPQVEYVLFAEHCGADNIAKGEAGYGAKCDELRGFLFEPLRAYLCEEFERAGMLNPAGKIAANVACGFSASAGGMASRHYFSRSQWWLPTEEHYEALRNLLNSAGRTEYLWREYEYLRREYEDLRREYEDLRRPFAATKDAPYTDVWDFATVPARKGKHPCEKPSDMLEHIIRVSSRPGDTVLDCFAGSGSTLTAALKLERRAIGIEQDPEWCEQIRDLVP